MAATPSGAGQEAHPFVMQQAANEVATAPTRTLQPFASAPSQPAIGGSSASLQREVFGFALLSSLANSSIGYPSWNFSLLSTVAVFGLHVNSGDGSFAADSGWNEWNSADMTNLLTTAHNNGVKVVLTIILQDFSGGTPYMCAGLANRATTVSATVAQVNAKGVDGVNIDYEGLNGSCPNGQTPRAMMTDLVTQMKAALVANAAGRTYLSVDTYASSAGDPAGFFDIPGLSPYADSFFVMAYDSDWSNYNAPPLNCSRYCLSPVSPLTGYLYNDTRASSEYRSAVPASKVILGLPYYSRADCVYSWAANQYPAFPNDSSHNFNLPYTQAVTMASDPTNSQYNLYRDGHDGVSPWSTWASSSSPACSMEMYWDDVTSLGAKYDLVNHDGLRGVGLWNLNQGGGSPELWSTLASHFSLIPAAPPNVAACAGTVSATVSWRPATTAGGPITSYTVTASPGTASVTVAAPNTIATLTGLTAGTAYTISVHATNGNGDGVSATAGTVTPISGPPVQVSYLSWFDNATPGMVGDNIHILNTGASQSSGCLTVTGSAVVPFTLAAGQEQHLSPTGPMLGGPVLVSVNTGPAILATQRVQYYQSFNEVRARSASDAAQTSYLSWFDKASPGMVGDNIHIVNPGSVAATGTVSLPGASPLNFTVGPMGESYVTFPFGTIGGPVTVNASQPVLASQRVQYYQSFNEVVSANAADAAPVSYASWFDTATAGMAGDNIHVVNPGTNSANVTVSLPGAAPIAFTLAPAAERHVTFSGAHIGGPVTISSTQPVIASQRVQYFQSFNEFPFAAPSKAVATSYLMWFDSATAGMVGDNIHIVNPGSAAATVTVTLPGLAPAQVVVQPLATAHVTFPAGQIGGPVTISSTVPVVASQRVQYYQSFNEIASSS